MTIVYPVSLPSSPGFRTSRVVANDVVTAFQGAAPIVSAITRPGGRWELWATVPPMTRAQAGAWIGFFGALKGSYGRFLAGDPDYSAAAGASDLSAVRVNGADQTGRALAVDGLTPSTTAAVAAGDYFQLGTGPTARLYRVLEDADSDGSGAATLTVFPELESPADDTPLRFTAPQGVFRLANGVRGEWMSDAASIHRGFEIRAISAKPGDDDGSLLLEDGWALLLEDGTSLLRLEEA